MLDGSGVGGAGVSGEEEREYSGPGSALGAGQEADDLQALQGLAGGRGRARMGLGTRGRRKPKGSKSPGGGSIAAALAASTPTFEVSSAAGVAIVCLFG